MFGCGKSIGTREVGKGFEMEHVISKLCCWLTVVV
jgi:hypothetical protein